MEAKEALALLLELGQGEAERLAEGEAVVLVEEQKEVEPVLQGDTEEVRDTVAVEETAADAEEKREEEALTAGERERPEEAEAVAQLVREAEEEGLLLEGALRLAVLWSDSVGALEAE